MFEMRKSVAAMAVVAATATGGAVAHADAPGARDARQSAVSPAFYTNTYWVTNGALCLDADTGTLHAKSTKVQLWSCNAGEQQHWVFHAVSGKPYVFTITNVGGDNKCLDADTGTINQNGTIVHLYPCDNWLGQQWYIWSPDGYQLHLQNEASGRYLDAATEKAGQNGDPVQLWDWNGGRSSQTWGTPSP